MEFGIAVSPGQLPRIFGDIWDVPFYLAFVIFVGDLSYLEPSRGALCDNAVVDTSLRRSGAPYLGFRIVWRGIIVPELCSSAVGVLDLSGSVGQTVQLGHVTIMVRGERF